MKKAIIISILACISVFAGAQSISALLVPTDSRSLATGGVLLPDYSQTIDAQAYFGSWAPSTAKNTVVGADVYFHLGKSLALILGGRSFIDKAYGISGDQGTVTGSYKPYDIILSLGAAYDFTDAVSAALVLHSVTSSLSEKAAGSAFCADISATYKGQNWSASIGGRNIGSKINYGGGDWPLPGLVAVSGSYCPINSLKVLAKADYLFSGALMAGAGVEYGFRDMVFARAGYHYGDNAKALPSFLSLGLGGKFKGISLDATYILLSDTIGNSIMVSLRYAL